MNPGPTRREEFIKLEIYNVLEELHVLTNIQEKQISLKEFLNIILESLKNCLVFTWNCVELPM